MDKTTTSLILGGAAIGLVATVLGKKRSQGSDFVFDDEVVTGGTGDDVDEAPEGRDELEFYLREAGLNADWVTFLTAVAKGESNFNNLVGLGNPDLFPDWARPNMRASATARAKEAAAAKAVYERNARRYGNCGYPASRYVFGSGGWFGMLPGSGLQAFWGTRHQCLDPWSVFEPAASVVMAIDYAKRVMRRDSFGAVPTWLNLRVGWGLPGGMGEKAHLDRVRPKLARHLAQIGVDESFMDKRVPPLPSYNPATLLDRLREA